MASSLRASDAESFVDNKQNYIADNNKAFVIAKLAAASLEGINAYDAAKMEVVWTATKMHDTTIQDGAVGPDVSGGLILSFNKASDIADNKDFVIAKLAAASLEGIAADNKAFVIAKLAAASSEGIIAYAAAKMEALWAAANMHDSTIQDGGASPDVSGGPIVSSNKA